MSKQAGHMRFDPYIRCEGSGTPGDRRGWAGTTVARCQVCNSHFHAPDAIPDHERVDILGMAEDGGSTLHGGEVG